jgi:glycerate kinase
MVGTLDRALAHFAQIALRTFPDADPDFPGAGAAGGLGFAFRTFLNGTRCSGAELVLTESRLESYILRSDLVITGEGRLDGQTVQGKGPAAVAALAKKHGKPVIVLAGSLGDDASECLRAGVDAYFPIVVGPCALQEALHPYTARTNLTRTAEQVLRAVRLFAP